MKRFFLGIPLSAEVQEKVKPIVKELQQSKADIRLVALENLHFTIKFLGEMDEERVPEIEKKVKELQISSFSFQVVGVGVFPSVKMKLADHRSIDDQWHVRFAHRQPILSTPEFHKRMRFNEVKLHSLEWWNSACLQRMQTIWVGTESKELKGLLMKVNRALSYLRKEEREELPHATLARVKSGKGKEKLQEIVQKYASAEFGEMRVEKIILYESELTLEGPVYKAVKEISLENKA